MSRARPGPGPAGAGPGSPPPGRTDGGRRAGAPTDGIGGYARYQPRQVPPSRQDHHRPLLFTHTSMTRFPFEV
ncbi:hypothetical protein GA0070606_3218 [Micromonospora citrea]|uniref:Uncharacterized protein n=1 Tax=Micromonospora citrea TaxID=47855 RepID=A0A1C6V1D6_9ACTN|nr:hypothetical protein GA0070606_3218 [Micromonospora citrea]